MNYYPGILGETKENEKSRKKDWNSDFSYTILEYKPDDDLVVTTWSSIVNHLTELSTTICCFSYSFQISIRMIRITKMFTDTGLSASKPNQIF